MLSQYNFTPFDETLLTITWSLKKNILYWVYLGGYNGTYRLDQMNNSTSYYRPPTKLQEGNVVSHVCPSVCQSVHGEGVSCDHYPWCFGPHCTGPSISSPSPLCQPWPLGHGPHCTGILPSASDIWWPSWRSIHLRPSTGADIWWLLKHTRSARAGGTYPTGMLSCLKKAFGHYRIHQNLTIRV